MRGLGYSGTILLVWLLVGMLAVAFTVWLAVRAWKRRKATSAARTVMALCLAVLGLYAAVETVLGLAKGLSSVGLESTDPSQKARLLAEGISTAMSCTAFGLLVALAGVAFALARRKSQT